MKDNKKKGYALAIVIILIFIMTITLASSITIVMRYMFFARDNLQRLGSGATYIGGCY